MKKLPFALTSLASLLLSGMVDAAYPVAPASSLPPPATLPAFASPLPPVALTLQPGYPAPHRRRSSTAICGPMFLQPHNLPLSP